jgi:hypothetical protein
VTCSFIEGARVANEDWGQGTGGFGSLVRVSHQAKNVLNVKVLLKRAVVNWIGRPAPGPWDSQRGDLRGRTHGPKGGQ